MDGSRIRFRALAMGDLALLRTWLNRPHVARWWSGWPSAEQVAANYAPIVAQTEPTRGYVILLDAAPVGYIQCYLIRDWPDYARHLGVENCAAGVDLFVGEPGYVHRGLGPAILRAFLRDVVFPVTDAASCVIGPAVNNRAAIRAYEKAGFEHLKTVAIPGELEPEYLMRITRCDFEAQARARGTEP